MKMKRKRLEVETEHCHYKPNPKSQISTRFVIQHASLKRSDTQNFEKIWFRLEPYETCEQRISVVVAVRQFRCFHG